MAGLGRFCNGASTEASGSFAIAGASRAEFSLVAEVAGWGALSVKSRGVSGFIAAIFPSSAVTEASGKEESCPARPDLLAWAPPENKRTERRLPESNTSTRNVLVASPSAPASAPLAAGLFSRPVVSARSLNVDVNRMIPATAPKVAIKPRIARVPIRPRRCLSSRACPSLCRVSKPSCGTAWEGKAGLDSQKACLSEAPGSNSCGAKAGSGGSGLDSTRQFPRRAAGSSRLGAAAESSSSGSVSEIAASSSVGGK